MDRVRGPQPDTPTAEVVDFDDALLDTYPADVRNELLAEASLLAQAFAPGGRCEELEAMARALSMGGRGAEMDRKRARGLAAALRRLAHDPWSAAST